MQPQDKQNISRAGISPINAHNAGSITTINQYGLGDNISGGKVVNMKFHGPVTGVAGNIEGDQIIQQAPTQGTQELAEIAKEIRDLLDRLSQNQTPATPAQQMQFSTQVLETIEQQPTLNQRFFKALKEFGYGAVEAAIDHPLAKPVVRAIKAFQEG